MIEKYSKIIKNIDFYLEKELRREVSKNQIKVDLLKNRYFECLDLKEIPSPRIFLDYLNPDVRENFSLDLAAKSCEFYGGLNYEYLKNDKNPFNLNDFELMLSSLYHKFSNFDNNYESLFEKSSEILRVFRNSTAYFRNYGTDSKVIHLY